MPPDDDDATGVTKREGPEPRTIVDADPAAVHDDARLPPGTAVGRYILIDTVGAGGMGVVYSAFDPELDRKVAIKLLQARPGGSETGGQTWLLREAQAMARLAHPNVVAVHDVGAMPGDRVFVAMELVEGVNLRQWLKQTRAWSQVLPIMRAAGAGLAAAHAAGLVHRDFKPDNVLVGNDGRTRVMDFGLARLDSKEPYARTSDLHIEMKSPLSERLTAAGSVLGTPAYMAPEIYAGHGADARTDQFAFGVAFYEAVYRARPYDRTALVEQRATPPKPPASARVPAWLERTILRAIALDPEERFSSMDALLAELEKDPTARRRGLVVGASFALAAGGVLAAVVALRGGGTTAPESELCNTAPAQLASTWGPAARTALGASFGKIQRPFVAETIKRTEAALDTYGAGWIAMRTEACKATRVLGHQSEEVLTLRMQCLDDRLTELGTIVGLFGAADEALVQGAVTSVQKLSPVADCADVAALRAPDPLPKDPALRQRASALQKKLVEARATYKASRPRDALALTEALTAEVTAVGYRPAEAAYHFLIGQTRWVLQGAEKGEPELLKAVYAAEAGKADEIGVEAWLQLANLATEQGKFDVAQERWQHASASLARLGGHWDLQVRVHASQALRASRQSKYDDALAAAKQARAIADKHPESPSYGYALLVEASILNASARPAEALVDFQKVLDYQNTLGHNRIDVVVTIQNMASAEGQLGQIDKALEHAKAALAITESIYGAETMEVARALGTVAAMQTMNNEYAVSLATNQRALEIAKRTVGEKDELYAQILGQIAGTLVSLERPAEAIPYLDTAETVVSGKLGPGHVQTLTIVLTKCDALHAAKKLPAAIAECKRALAAGEASLGHDSPILFLFLAHLGMVHVDAKQPREAAAAFDRALKLGTADPSDVYYVAFLDAGALWDSGEKARAVELATKARAGFASLGEAKTEQLAEVDAWLAKHPKSRR